MIELQILEMMDDFTEIDPASIFIYEAGLEKSDPIFDKNQGILMNATRLLMYLIKKVKSLIDKFFSSMKNCIDYIFLKKEDKERYDQYVAYIKSHPNMKDKKITVKDWKAIERHYDAALRRAEVLSKKVAERQITEEEAKKEEKSIMDDLTSLTGKCSAIVTVETALRMAKACPESARQVAEYMTKDQNLMNALEKELGKKEMNKFQNKVQKMTKETYFSKLRSLIMAKKQKDIFDVVDDIMNEIGNLDTTSGKVKFAVNNRGIIKRAGKEYITNKETRQEISRVKEKTDAVKEISKKYIEPAKTIKKTFIG